MAEWPFPPWRRVRDALGARPQGDGAPAPDTPPEDAAGARSRRGFVVAAAGVVAAALCAATVVPEELSRTCLDPVDLMWLTATIERETARGGLWERAIPPTGPDLDGFVHGLLQGRRPLAVIQLRILRELGGLSAPAWFWLMALLHLINAALLALVASRLGLRGVWAVGVALVFLASGIVPRVFAVRYLLEIALLKAHLLLVLAYLGRAAATTRRERGLWLAAEAVAVVFGLCHKESMVAYPLALAALEAGWFAPRFRGTPGERWRAIGGRLAPHAAIGLLALALALVVLSNTNSPPASASPLNAARQLLALLAHAAVPWLAHRAGPLVAGALVLAALATACWRIRDPALRTAALLSLAIATPMLPFVDRVAAGYLYQPWAGLALAAVAAVRATDSRLAAGGVLAGLGLLSATPSALPREACVVDASLVRTVERHVDCTAPRPVWRVDTPTWQRVLERWRQVRPGDPRWEECERLASPKESWHCFHRRWPRRHPSADTWSPVGKLHHLLWVHCDSYAAAPLFVNGGPPPAAPALR